jgi:hypothetical protein
LAGTEDKNAGPLKHGPAQIHQPQFHSVSDPACLKLEQLEENGEF